MCVWELVSFYFISKTYYWYYRSCRSHSTQCLLCFYFFIIWGILMSSLFYVAFVAFFLIQWTRKRR